MDKLNIRNIFMAELMNCKEYTLVLNMEKYIIESINTPFIQEHLKYIFETPQTPEEIETIRLCQKILFGFSSEEINSEYCIIEMKNFLDII
jgi:hypothetical protein